MAINEAAKKKGWGYDKANARLSVYVDGEEMLGFDATNNVIYPIDDDTFSLGKSTAELKDLYIDGVAYIDGLGDDMLVATTKKLQFFDTGIYVQASADGKLKLASDGASTDDITLSGTITLDDDLITPTTKKIQFRDSGIYINSGADGKLTIASDGAGTDDITLSGTITTDDSILIANGKAIRGSVTDNQDFVLQGYVTGSSAYANALEIQNVTGGTVEIGFFGKIPAARQAHLADAATTISGYVTINSLLLKLETLGLIATA